MTRLRPSRTSLFCPNRSGAGVADLTFPLDPRVPARSNGLCPGPKGPTITVRVGYCGPDGSCAGRSVAAPVVPGGEGS